MLRFTRKPSSGSHSQCLAKITHLVHPATWRSYRRCQCYGCIIWPVRRVCAVHCVGFPLIMTQFNQYVPAQFLLRSVLIVSCYLRLCFFHVDKFLYACYIFQFCDAFWCGTVMQLKFLFCQNEVCSTWNDHEIFTCMWPNRRRERTNEKRKSFELISGLSFEPGSHRNETRSRRSIHWT